MTRMHTRITDQPHTRTTTYRRSAIIGTMTERCPYCSGTNIIRKGKREKKLETVQLWHCRDCVCVFTPQLAKGKTYPLKAILAGLSLYYSGRTTAQTTKLLKERYGLTLNPRTLGTWLTEYKPLTTYNRLREQGSKRFTSYQLIRSVRLHHQQVYMFRTHRAKLDLLLTTPEHRAFLPIAEYLTDVAEDCPHHLFQGEHRASAGKAAFNLDSVEIKERQNLAPRIASLVLQAVTHNKRRHDELQRFMLTNDSVTVAVEVPIYLTPEDLAHLKDELGFDIPIAADTTLTGHIDLLQIRNGAIHILDYKPHAAREKPIAQLMVYALALSRRTGLRLYDFTCAWFDEHHYFEFFPLHVVHKLGHSRPSRHQYGQNM